MSHLSFRRRVGISAIGALLFALVVPSTLHSSRALAQANITVSATGWTDTEIDVQAGSPLGIAASGSWGEGDRRVGPAGNPDAWPDNFFNLTDLGVCNVCARTKAGHFEALVGYIGSVPPPPGSYTSKTVLPEAKKVFYVGDSYSKDAQGTGRLWLAMNADAYSGYTVDNSGQVTATVNQQIRGGLLVPSSGTVTQLFLGSFTQEKWYPSYYNQSNKLVQRGTPEHSGIDISNTATDCANTSPVYAAATGTVIWAGFDPSGRGFGWSVILRHSYDLGSNHHYTYTLYGHMGTVGTTTTASRSCLEVEAGDSVSTSTVLGYQGSSGLTSRATHVHFTVLAGPDDVSSTLSSPYELTRSHATYPASPDYYTCLGLTADDSPNELNKPVTHGSNAC